MLFVTAKRPNLVVGPVSWLVSKQYAMDIRYFCQPAARLFLARRSFNGSARADWIELIRLSGQTLLSVSGWDTILSSLPRSTTQRKPPLPSMRELSITSKSEGSGNAGSIAKSDYPITTERAGIVSRFVEDIVFGDGVAWDLSTVSEEGKGKKKKPKK
jgi:hypothetical protein